MARILDKARVEYGTGLARSDLQNAKGHGGTVRTSGALSFSLRSRMHPIGGGIFLEMLDLLGSE
ncbi:MAG TPA: hypothetical protein VMT09_11260 [Steroidobacteraceae bacterium]|nr:hypothetical protein [Steroidobacteraceae bacterium]